MIIDRCRDLKELKKLYDSRPMPTQYDWDWLINNPNLFCFYDEGITPQMSPYATSEVKDKRARCQEGRLKNDNGLTSCLPDICSSIMPPLPSPPPRRGEGTKYTPSPLPSRYKRGEGTKTPPLPSPPPRRGEGTKTNPRPDTLATREVKGYLRGFITVQRENGLLTLSGTSVRKNMTDNIQAIIKVCEAFDEDIYAFTNQKHAGLTLKKAGFKHIKDDEYVKYKTPRPGPLATSEEREQRHPLSLTLPLEGGRGQENRHPPWPSLAREGIEK